VCILHIRRHAISSALRFESMMACAICLKIKFYPSASKLATYKFYFSAHSLNA
jgi:hypothetical protein